MSQRVRAPQLDTNLGWLNTDRPLSLSGELKGQIVILDFWTYCCINCMHILPDLAWLEKKYAGDPVTFLGVHSAKFANETSRETIRAAVLRYEIHHPVAIDDDRHIWRQYAVRSWPTLVVIDAEGYIAHVSAGEGNRDVIDQAIADLLDEGRQGGTLAGAPLAIRRDQNVRAASGLTFPGKVLADAETNRLYVADSNHNRIIIAELPDDAGRSRVLTVVGSGEVGKQDGAADVASFHHPQGLVAGQGYLYVADTENHLVRSIDLSTYAVRTIVGTGKMSNDRAGGLMGVQQGLNSPWDLAIEGSTLYVAMAGTHQIWRIDLPVGFARAFAGSGRENIVDGPTETAALAQPSGICAVGGKLYFADSEVSAIRGIDMDAEQVFTIIGEGLFSFGDADGTHPKAKLQHPLGIDAWEKKLVVADTYNHKIKLVDSVERSATSLYGTGRAGASCANASGDGWDVAFFEPGGLSVMGNLLFVADTNNHRIVRIDLVAGGWREIMLEGLTAPAAHDRETSAGSTTAGEPHALDGATTSPSVREVDAVSIAPDGDVELILDIKLPAKARMSPEAPWSVRVTVGERTLLQQTGKSGTLPLKVLISADRIPPHGTWNVTASLAYCTSADGGLCVPIELTWTILVSTDGHDSIISLPGSVYV